MLTFDDPRYPGFAWLTSSTYGLGQDGYNKIIGDNDTRYIAPVYPGDVALGEWSRLKVRFAKSKDNEPVWSMTIKGYILPEVSPVPQQKGRYELDPKNR